MPEERVVTTRPGGGFEDATGRPGVECVSAVEAGVSGRSF
jgi:hypothetical protein